MACFRGTWTARVDQDFEVEAEDMEEALEVIWRDVIKPSQVVELLDAEAIFREEEA